MQQFDYTKPVIVRMGTQTSPFYIKPGFNVVDLLFDENLVAEFGFSPFNTRVLRNGVSLDYRDDLVPSESLTLETAANIKEALPGPKIHKCERYFRRSGFRLETSKGDHLKLIVGSQAISVNYCNGELDIRSLKDLARHLNLKPRELIFEILTS